MADGTIADSGNAATLPMHGPGMTTTDGGLTVQRVDAAIRFGGLLVRALAYAAIYALADRYDCGRSILTGVLAGDIGSRLVSIAWEWRDGLLQFAAELVLLLLVFLFVRSQMVWPEDLALRAIVGLAAFGVFSMQLGGAVFTRLGPSENGFA